jgi:HSP20 family protein
MRANDPWTWMWTDACAQIERAERLHRQFFQPSAAVGWQPPIDVFETERELWIMAALPGVERRDVEIIVEPDAVTIVGVRPLPPMARGATIHRLEIPHGRFERRIEMSTARLQLGRSERADGCLILNFTKRP